MAYFKSWIFIGLDAIVLGAHIPRTTNMAGLHVFFAMSVASFEVFLGVFLIKQFFHSHLLDIYAP